MLYYFSTYQCYEEDTVLSEESVSAVAEEALVDKVAVSELMGDGS